MTDSEAPRLTWDCGTAYDLFVSLHILHHPDEFGLRGLWAAGVRSRLPPGERQVLEESVDIFHFPLGWVHTLTEPKDSAAALEALRCLPPAERLPALGLSRETPPEVAAILQAVAQHGIWSAADLEALQHVFTARRNPPRPARLQAMLEWWSHPREYGERYLQALEVYRQVFFAEEEARISPALAEAQSRAQDLAQRSDLPSLLEELSQGVRFAALTGVAELVLAPSYWITPLIVYSRASDERLILLYGARPSLSSLVPGELVPDALLHALKALADPTRLRILRYLAEQPHTPAQLSRRLRLRAPTVIHHLNALRLAGLVYLTLEAEGERYYAARAEQVSDTFEDLQAFLDTA